MNHKEKYFILYSNCEIVRGAKRSILVDLQLNRYMFIPNILCDILQLSRKLEIGQIKENYNNEINEGLDKYIDLLCNENWGHFVNTPKNFPKINFNFDIPEKISNIILDIGFVIPNLNKIIPQINDLNCENLQIRILEPIDSEKILTILSSFKKSTIVFLELVIPFDFFIEEEGFKLELMKFPFLKSLIIYKSTKYQSISVRHKISNVIAFNQFYIKDNLNVDSCGLISESYFNINLQLFSESQKHNTCLNRKLSIDLNGEIKNCPSMLKSFGNIKNTTLNEALNKTGFKKLWNINKDKIEVCKDCEFRHICTDCRAYIQNPKNIYSKPAKCSYDPYAATWGTDNPTNNPLYGQ